MKKNNGIVYFVAVCIVFSLMISSCVTIRDTSRNYDLVPEIHYQNLLDLTIVSTGNNYRLKKVLQKLSSGEDVYIAALGGSVTEGLYLKNYKNGYAYQFYRKMRDRFTDNNGTNMHFLSR